MPEGCCGTLLPTETLGVCQIGLSICCIKLAFQEVGEQRMDGEGADREDRRIDDASARDGPRSMEER